eukprot:TRINITY_DN9376_c0_g6_i2.p1 TRINITY_DN9376_c0_g6~~TRINITY_DN9376_c0_g6_i2.p1  ORF type:complete len:698 (-),score=145.22 TRINITY_DN9376_c0_g6_i2:236-2329(-)
MQGRKIQCNSLELSFKSDNSHSNRKPTYLSRALKRKSIKQSSPSNEKGKCVTQTKLWNKVKDIKRSLVNPKKDSTKGCEKNLNDSNMKQRKLNSELTNSTILKPVNTSVKHTKNSLTSYQNSIRHKVKQTPSKKEEKFARRAESVLGPKEMSPLKVASKAKDKVFARPLSGSSSFLEKPNTRELDNSFSKRSLKPSSSLAISNKLSATTSANKLNTSTRRTSPNNPILSVRNLEKFTAAKYAEEVVQQLKAHFKISKAIPATRIEFYRVGRLLGKGAFGKVNLGMHKLSGKLVAIKSIQKSVLVNKESQRKVKQEFSVLRGLRHPNVVRLYESFETEQHMVIVMELCAGGDLLSFIRNRKKLKEDVARLAFKSLIMGLNHCHSKGVLHRDIKPDNILINGEGILKIADFGVATHVKQGTRMLERCGTPAYTAPEVLKGKGYQGFAVDLWSAGVVLYAMLYGTVPFKANNIKDLHHLILKGKYALKDDISEEARDLIKKLLEKNVRKRLSVPEVLGHRWMRKVVSETSVFTRKEKESFGKQEWANAEGKSVFTEQNLEADGDEVGRNSTTKSAVLGPFNTTLSDHEIVDVDTEGYEVLDKEKAIKFSVKVKDLDRQYEKDNNGEIDNGIYINLIYNSENQAKNEEDCIDSEDDTELAEEFTEKKPFIEFNAHKTRIIGSVREQHRPKCSETNRGVWIS